MPPPPAGLVGLLARADRISDLADQAAALGADEVASILRVHAARHVAFAAGMVSRLGAVAVRLLRDVPSQAEANQPAGAAEGSSDSARSASAVMVSDGLTPGFAETLEPSTTKRPG